MPILHKNITAETDIHNPKWFINANNGDYAWKNEQGNLESIDELLLPAALNFVDGSVAPPTSNTGDIYVLSSGGSVNAGWGSVSLQDWVRYDGAAWNSITPQKSSLCYNESTDKLLSFDGTAWAVLGGDSIYTASGTVPTSVVATLTDTLSLKGSNTSSASSNLKILDSASSILWDFRNNGNVHTGQDNFIYFEDEITVLTQSDLNTKFRVSNGDDKTSRLFIGGNSGGFQGLQLQYFGNNTAVAANMRGKQALYGEYGHGELIISNNAANEDAEIWFNIGRGSTDDWFINRRRVKITKDDFKIHNVSGLIYHPTNDEPTKIGTENVSLQGETLIKGNGTTTGTTLALYDNDTTPNKNAEFKDNGNVSFYNLPTSATGLSAGDIWNDSGTLKIV